MIDQRSATISSRCVLRRCVVQVIERCDRWLVQAKYEPPWLSWQQVPLDNWKVVLDKLDRLLTQVAALESVLEGASPLFPPFPPSPQSGQLLASLACQCYECSLIDITDIPCQGAINAVVTENELVSPCNDPPWAQTMGTSRGAFQSIPCFCIRAPFWS